METQFSMRRLSRSGRTLGALAVVFALVQSMNFIASAGKRTAQTARRATATATTGTKHLYDPSARDEFYGQPLDVAKYLVDLHDAKAPFDFCGGMMFQLVLSEKLRAHLASEGAEPPVVFDSFKPRMFMTPGYSQDADADNVRIFHGREIRQVPHASGGMGFVLQLSMAEGDPEGWTPEEIKEYDGWGHDSGRSWRTADRWEQEGVQGVKAKFGDRAFGLHHRFYLHFDFLNRMWLSAEDGCEGHPANF
ncbi:unnamed protein product [Effrenium voratum]|nr:unnamed protein product [Effrenium voratum]